MRRRTEEVVQHIDGTLYVDNGWEFGHATDDKSTCTIAPYLQPRINTLERTLERVGVALISDGGAYIHNRAALVSYGPPFRIASHDVETRAFRIPLRERSSVTTTLGDEKIACAEENVVTTHHFCSHAHACVLAAFLIIFQYNGTMGHVEKGVGHQNTHTAEHDAAERGEKKHVGEVDGGRKQAPNVECK